MWLVNRLGKMGYPLMSVGGKTCLPTGYKPYLSNKLPLPNPPLNTNKHFSSIGNSYATLQKKPIQVVESDVTDPKKLADFIQSLTDRKGIMAFHITSSHNVKSILEKGLCANKGYYTKPGEQAVFFCDRHHIWYGQDNTGDAALVVILIKEYAGTGSVIRLTQDQLNSPDVQVLCIIQDVKNCPNLIKGLGGNPYQGFLDQRWEQQGEDTY